MDVSVQKRLVAIAMFSTPGIFDVMLDLTGTSNAVYFFKHSVFGIEIDRGMVMHSDIFLVQVTIGIMEN